MTVDADSFVSHEFVKGNQEGITEVKSTSRLLPDGRLHSKSQSLKNGKWIEGHEFYYSEDSEARVIFR